jgi:hypothetical protein
MGLVQSDYIYSPLLLLKDLLSCPRLVWDSFVRPRRLPLSPRHVPYSRAENRFRFHFSRSNRESAIVGKKAYIIMGEIVVL